VDRIPHLRRLIVGAVIVVVLVVAAGASARPQRTVVLRIETNGVVTGTDGLRCAGLCSIPFRRGALVTLNASGRRHFEFDGWSEGCVGAVPSCVVSLNTSVSVRAMFVGESTAVSLSVSGPGTIVSHPKGLACGKDAFACDAEFPWGTRLTLTAHAAAGGAFAAWGAACWNVGLGGCILKLGAGETDVTSAFRHVEPLAGPQQLTVVPRGPPVTSTPAGINCPAVCTTDFPSGTRVRLDTRGSWSGTCVSESLGRCLLVVDAPVRIAATLPQPHATPSDNDLPVRVSVSGRGKVTAPGIKCNGVAGTLSDCSNFFAPKTAVTLRARAAKKGRFLGWDLFCKDRGTKPKCTLFLSTSMIVGAHFKH
jgi:List-Bact-rpt repeat protein